MFGRLFCHLLLHGRWGATEFQIYGFWIPCSVPTELWKQNKNGWRKVGEPGGPPRCARRSKEKHVLGWVSWAFYHIPAAWAGEKRQARGWGRTTVPEPEISFRDRTRHSSSLQLWGILSAITELWSIHIREVAIRNPSDIQAHQRGKEFGITCTQGPPTWSLQLGWAIRQWLWIKTNLEKIRTNTISCPISTQHLVD